MDSSFSAKDEIWFLRVCHHVSNAVQAINSKKVLGLSAIVKQSYPLTGLDRPFGLREIEDPRISRQSAHEGGKVVSPVH